VHLAKVLRAGGNVLLLDEPTNDLDVETLRALEEALLNFPGCAWSSRTIAGSSIASPPTSSPSRAIPRWSGSRATTRTTWDQLAGVLLEVTKDLLYQVYVRKGRLQQAMMMRRFFADESIRNLAPPKSTQSG
jgi:hypothetical protein